MRKTLWDWLRMEITLLVVLSFSSRLKVTIFGLSCADFTVLSDLKPEPFSIVGSENNSLYIYYKGLSKHLLTFKFDTVRSVLERERREEDANEFVSAVCWRPVSRTVFSGFQVNAILNKKVAISLTPSLLSLKPFSCYLKMTIWV